MAKAKAKSKAKPKTKPKAKKKAPAGPKPALKASAASPSGKVNWLGPQMPHISPYLSVRDGMAALAFYERAFGFKRRFEMKTDDGRLRHGEVEHHGGVIMIGEPQPEMGYKAPAEVGGSPVSLYVYVPDVDATVAAARAAGATIVSEPKDQFYGDRTCELTDPEGHRWCFATHVKDVDPADLKM
jgi:PhnB protein